VLDGAPITPARASERLDYRLDRSHTAAIIWNDTDGSDLADLERAVEAVAGSGPAPRARSPWSPAPRPSGPGSPARGPPRHEDLEAALDDLPGVRVALGPTAHGVEGFRRSHLDALTPSA
jgi:DNA-binding PucR family transcriptional regulator